LEKAQDAASRMAISILGHFALQQRVAIKCSNTSAADHEDSEHFRTLSFEQTLFVNVFSDRLQKSIFVVPTIHHRNGFECVSFDDETAEIDGRRPGVPVNR